MRAKAEHPFRVIKRQFGLIKVRFRGLQKNTAHLQTLFALCNLWMVRRHLMGAVRPRLAGGLQTRPKPHADALGIMSLVTHLGSDDLTWLQFCVFFLRDALHECRRLVLALMARGLQDRRS